MTITFYVNWAEQEIYKNDEELLKGYLEYCCDEDDFREWLNENYNSDEIFAFEDFQKEEVKKSYQEYLIQSAQNWVYDNGMEQEINI